MPLHTDKRPRDFKDIVGNKITVDALEAILEREDKPHTFLFSGPSGCGKTTLARILSKRLECSDHDLSEINISNNRGIDTARDILTNMRFQPMKGRVRIFLLDEVHKSTNEFQNALLKALEEPPAHVYFILCTTEPEKLLKTVKNRCSVFTVNKLPERRINKFIKKICKEENIDLSDEVIKMIGEEVEGCPRQALVTLDQIKDIDTDNEDKLLEIIQASKIEEKQVIDLCRELINSKSDWKSVSKIIKSIDAEPEKIRRAVLGYCSAVLLNKDNPQAALVIDCFKNHFYDSGKAGLILACYEVFSN